MIRNRHEVKKRRRDELWIQQQGRCFWCRGQMMHWNDLHADPNKKSKYGIKVVNGLVQMKAMPPKLATIEHLRDRFDPTRTIPPQNQEQRWALACWGCNSERGKQRQAEQPIEELRARGRHQ